MSAPQPTVEALVFGLREGIAAVAAHPDRQRRLSELSRKQLCEVCGCTSHQHGRLTKSKRLWPSGEKFMPKILTPEEIERMIEKVATKKTRADPKPQAETGPLARILDAVHGFLGRFVIYPSKEAHDAHLLWIAHAHCMDAWESTPRIAFLSPEPKSGKTRAIEVSELLVPNAVEAINVTPAYLFRKVGSESGPPTILFDEIDTVFGPRAKENEEIRGLLNAGHRRGAVAGRCVVKGKTVETEEIPGRLGRARLVARHDTNPLRDHSDAQASAG
jgi:hypothetical protein